VGVRLSGEDLDLVAESGELAAQVPDVDALAATVRLAPVGEESDAHVCTRGPFWWPVGGAAPNWNVLLF
jgi:hypothetical protein